MEGSSSSVSRRRKGSRSSSRERSESGDRSRSVSSQPLFPEDDLGGCSSRSSAVAHKVPPMDHHLWSELPEDVLDKILPWLPISSLFRFRSVCRKWNSIIATRSFLDMYAKAPQEAWILMFADPHYKTVLAYDTEGNNWHTLPLSFLPANIYYVTVAGGLLCFRLVEPDGGTSMCMCNPLTKAWKKLPPMLAEFYGGLVGMIADRGGSSAYKIVARSQRQLPAENGEEGILEIRTEAYDSTAEQWRVTGVPEDDLTTNHAYCHGILYFMTWEALNGIYAYNVDRGTWNRLSPPWGFFFTCPFLVACGDRLLMVGGYGSRHIDTVGIGIWEFAQPRRVWVEISRMPPKFVDDFITKSGSMYFNCVGHCNTVYMINYQKPPLITTFSVTERAWNWLDTCPPSVAVEAFLCFSFFPRLDALV